MTPSSPSPRPPERLLCGPGPTNVDPAALAAMDQPLLGHMDPVLLELMLELVDLLRAVYRAPDGLVLPLQATGTSGMEAGIANLVEPGDTVIVGASGYFGRRIIDMARRHGAQVVELVEDWGVHVPNARLLDALEQHPGAAMLAVVHAETSTGSLHPLAELGLAMRDRETLLMADCVTSLGGVEVDVSGWGIDYAYSCTQKCLGAPPGMSPVAVSERALERRRRRETPVPFAFDLELLEAYWVKRPATYHHTCPALHIYALHQVLKDVLAEGLEARWQRHERAGRHFQRRAREAGLELLAEPDHQLPQLSAVRVPDGIDSKAVQRALLDEHDLEIGGGLGPQAPDIWRVGLMGPNATTGTADSVLELLTAEIERRGASLNSPAP